MKKTTPEPSLKKADPERTMALKSLPPHIRETLTPEETDLFLYAEEWPEELFKKMEEFIIADKS